MSVPPLQDRAVYWATPYLSGISWWCNACQPHIRLLLSVGNSRASLNVEEREFLVQELSRAVGLGGRRRKARSAAERARLNVTVTLKSTIARISKHHKALGPHLTQTIKTGTFCSYAPDPRIPVIWEFA